MKKMTAGEAYKSMFQNYAKFSGRSRRSEYWYPWLINVLITGIASIALFGTMTYFDNYRGEISPISAMIAFCVVVYIIITFIPYWALTVRRLHDTGKSGCFILIQLIPYIGTIIMLVFLAQDSQNGQNRYGENPKEIS